MKKTILITGGTGFIGANLTRRLVHEGYKPTLLIRKNSNIWRLDDIKSKIIFVESDILNKKKLKSDISKIKPNIVYHLAVYGTILSEQQSIDKTMKVNLFGTMNLLEAINKLGCEYFIGTGSSLEYGQKTRTIRETDMLNPFTFYGASKAATTLLTQEYAKSYNLPTVILRLFSPYGFYDKSRFIPTVILHALQNKHLDLSSPYFVRDFIFIDDILEAYLYFLKGKKYYGEIINIGSGKQYRLKEVIQMIERNINRKLNVSWGKKQANQFEPKMWRADISKAKKMLNWEPQFDFSKGLLKTYTWFSKNLKFYF